ncbi:MAG: hypothetical protein HQM12_12390 [SAR324 cluster bacterium]|nr:hypothetical protein [SAR324 cluster bacterium]
MTLPEPMRHTDYDEFDIDRMRYFMSLSFEEKLRHLEQLNLLTRTLMPESSQRIWEQLQKDGF